MTKLTVRTLFLALIAVIAAPPVHAQSLRSTDAAEPGMAAFGGSVVVAGDQILVGEPTNNTRPGMVYVYGDRGGEWSELAQLTAPEGFGRDGFGTSMAVDGSTLLVGATGQREGTGAAYVFARDESGDWALVGDLTGSDSEAGDDFGRSLAISGDMAAVGAWSHNEEMGAVYLFARDGAGGWIEVAKLSPSDGAEGDRFGVTLALDGDVLMVGSTRHNEATGAVYVFGPDESGAWLQQRKLVATGIDQNSRFGSAILLDEGNALISAYFDNGRIGAAFVFQVDPETGGWEWQQSGRLVAFDGSPNARFGQDMAFDGNGEVWVGAPGSNRFVGAVYAFRFDMDRGGWTAATKVTSTAEGREFFGGSVAIGDGIAAVGATNADYGMGRVAIFERDAQTGEWVEVESVISEGESLDPIVGDEVKCEDGTAALFDCGQVDLLSFTPVKNLGGGRGVRVNDLWGWTDPETGVEYALVGRVDGTAFVDISDPNNPVYVGNLAKTADSPGSTWRDIKVYNGHAFIVADGAGDHGMQVFDLSRLREASGMPVEFTEDAHYDRIASAHNIVINEDAGFAFAVGASSGGETCGGGLHIINIQDPTNPTFAGCFADPQTGRASTGYSHDAQCVTYAGPDADYAGRQICFGANETALSIADVSDANNTVAIARATYPNVGYAHQGWLTDDHQYFFMDDELDEFNNEFAGTRTLIWDVSDLDDPVLAGEFFGATMASDHNLYIRGDTMYQSNYLAGLRVVDISDVTNPKEVGHFDTVPWGENSAGFGGSWSNYPFFESGVIAVTSGSEGLFLVKKKDQRLVP